MTSPKTCDHFWHFGPLDPKQISCPDCSEVNEELVKQDRFLDGIKETDGKAIQSGETKQFVHYQNHIITATHKFTSTWSSYH